MTGEESAPRRALSRSVGAQCRPVTWPALHGPLTAPAINCAADSCGPTSSPLVSPEELIRSFDLPSDLSGEAVERLVHLGEVGGEEVEHDVAHAGGAIPAEVHCRLGLASVRREIGCVADAEREARLALAEYRSMDMPYWCSRAESELTGILAG